MVDAKIMTTILIAVALLPVIINFISDANFTGTIAIIMTLVPLFLAIGLMTKFSSKGK